MVSVAAVRHGVTRIDRQVHDHLVDVRGVHFHRRESARQADFQLNVFPDDAPQHLVDAQNDLVEIHHAGYRHLAAAECQQLVGQRRGSFRRVQDLVRILHCRAILAHAIAQHFVVAQDHGEQIVEIVRHPAGQTAHRLHFLRVEKLVFQGDPLGSAPGDALFEFLVDPAHLLFGRPPFLRPLAITTGSHAPSARGWEERPAPASCGISITNVATDASGSDRLDRRLPGGRPGSTP